jgi:nucleoid-associated protein YgaU
MIYEGSRYVNNLAYERDGTMILGVRERPSFKKSNCIVHMFVLGETLDKLAYQNYGDPQLWWAILEANPKYNFEFEIKPGDNILIPTKQELMRLYGQSL